MNDPTYDMELIKSKPTWYLAWRISEVDNDNAPIGWWKYINIASWLHSRFEMIEKDGKVNSRP